MIRSVRWSSTVFTTRTMIMGMIKNQDFSRVNLVGDFFIPENESIEDIPCQNLKLIHKFISIEYEFLQYHCIFQALIWSIQEFRGFQSAKGWPIHFLSDFSDIGGLPNIVSRIAHFSIDGESTSRSQKTLDWNTWTRPSGPEERWWWKARTKTIEVDPSYKIRNRFWVIESH